jgi:hypothetical protein
VPPVGSFEEAEAFFSSLGTEFHGSITLFEKKFLLISRRAGWAFRFSGSAALLVVQKYADLLL